VTDPADLEELRRHLDTPVAPREAFARSLLQRLERELTGEGMSAEEIDAESGEELPLREAMSVICADPIGSVDLGAVLGDVEQPGTQPDQPA
jgi:hypothetical protein